MFFDKKVSYKGGSADVMRATLFGAKPIDMDNLDWENANEVAVKKFRPGDDSNKRAQSAVRWIFPCGDILPSMNFPPT